MNVFGVKDLHARERSCINKVCCPRSIWQVYRR